jgi:hypothetical protein
MVTPRQQISAFPDRSTRISSRFAMLLTLALSLPGCVGEAMPTAPDSPDAVAVAPAISALVNGEGVLFRSQPGESFFSLSMPQADYVMIVGNHHGPNGLEVLQVSLYNFVGVGTYVLNDDPFSHSGIGIYDRDTLPGHSYWAVGTPGDTAWVDSYDPVTGAIEGRFAFRGYPISDLPGQPTIEVTHGEFRGALR